MGFSLALMLFLLAACAIAMVIEIRGVPVVLDLEFKGDIKRESRWLAQYGQTVSSVVAALLVWSLDERHRRFAFAILVSTFTSSLLAQVLKRITSRVRPNREAAGDFLGPRRGHANYRESFPSAHSASAVALTVLLAALYPQAAGIFWILALTCAALRYVLGAHWPSDVLGGIALGYGVAHLAAWGCERFFA